ncbi:MAG: VWA domain-containing protein [Propionibacteriales bacterium]|nr:VWA domain-containing protein [Propionibacteriales bacterium]
MNFLEPHRLWLLLLVPALIGVYALLQLRKSHYAVRFTNLALLDSVAPRRVSWRQHVAVAIALVTLTGGVLLFAQPSKIVRVPLSIQSQFTVVLAMDVSLSMGATDVAPSRIAAAESAAKQFLARLPSNFKAALVQFAGQASLVVAPTTDHTSVAGALDSLELAERTATGEGIYTSLSVIAQEIGSARADAAGHVPALILMLSDGYRTAGRNQNDAARAARDHGVPVYTVAVGTADGVVSADGETVNVPVQPDELREVSKISGGKAYVAGTPSGLLDAYRAVGSQLVYTTERRDATSDYVPYLLLSLLLSTAAGLFVASRWPS